MKTMLPETIFFHNLIHFNFMSYKLQSHRGAPIFSECPKCSTKKFQPYLEFFKKTIIANHVGKCNACEYHFQPYDYQRLECFIPDEVRIRSLLNQEKNNLFLNLSTNFGKNMAVKAMEMYSVGTAVSGKYTGASIFW